MWSKSFDLEGAFSTQITLDRTKGLSQSSRDWVFTTLTQSLAIELVLTFEWHKSTKFKCRGIKGFVSVKTKLDNKAIKWKQVYYVSAHVLCSWWRYGNVCLTYTSKGTPPQVDNPIGQYIHVPVISSKLTGNGYAWEYAPAVIMPFAEIAFLLRNYGTA